MKFYILIFASVVALHATAQTHLHLINTNAVMITPELVLSLAAEAQTNNPALQAAQFRVDAARANEQTIRKWEDPTVRFGVMTAEREKRMDDGDLLGSVEQKLPLWGKPQAAQRVAEAGTKIQKASAEMQRFQIRKDIAQALYKAALAQRILEIERQDLDWLQTMGEMAQRRYEVGSGSQLEVLRLQNEHSKRDTALITDSKILEHEYLNLNRLLNRRIDSTWPPLKLPPLAGPIINQDKLIQYAIHNEPKLKMMREQSGQAEAMVEETKKKRLPDFNIGAEVRQFSESQELRQGMLTVSFNFPWGNTKKYKAEVQRDEANFQASQLDAADYELSLQSDIHHLTTKIDAAYREALLYRDEIIPRSQLALETARTGWEANRGMMSDVLDARRMLLEAESMQARAIAEQHQMIAELVLCCGIDDLEALDLIGTPPESESSERK